MANQNVRWIDSGYRITVLKYEKLYLEPREQLVSLRKFTAIHNARRKDSK